MAVTGHRSWVTVAPTRQPVHPTLNTPLHHYESCPARMVRDCVVISHTRRVLAAYRAIVLGAEQ